MSSPRMSVQQMEASPENQAGSYGESFWFRMFLNWIENKYPGSAEFIEQAAAILPWSNLIKAIGNAIADWKEGKDFLQILREMISEWVEIETPTDGPVRMTAKS